MLVLRLLFMIFQASLALAYDPNVLTLPVAIGKCEMQLLEQNAFTSHDLFHQHWIKYGSMKLTVKANYDGDDFVYLTDEREQYYFKVTDAEQVRALTQYFYTKMAPEGSELVIIDYPKIGKGFAYRGLIDFIYTPHLVPDKDGVIQIPGLPPIFQRKIDGKLYFDIPHPHVFNAYLGRKFFVSYTSNVYGRGRDAFDIPGSVFAKILSQDRYPIANVRGGWEDLLHDVLGHGVLMAKLTEQDVWKRTVNIINRVLKIQESLDEKALGRLKFNALNDKADRVQLNLTFWETAANQSGMPFARTQADVDKSIAKVTEEGRAGLAAAEKNLKLLEDEIELIQKESK